jgi:hypothetical protein
VRTALQCGHVITVPENEWPEWGDCPHCGFSVRVEAFECREWHVKCMDCRYGRWFGQDQDSAKRAHKNNDHRVQYAYMVLPAKREAVRNLYGRKVRVLIPDIPTVKKYSDVRRVILQVSRDTDIPPF